MARTKVAAVPEVGDEAPEFNLPSAQGGQLRLSMRTARGPVVVVFYRGLDFEEDVGYFKALADKEDEINLAAGSVVGVGVSEPDAARVLVSAAGIKSYVLYDYARVASREWGLLEKDKKLGEYARSAVFIVGADHSIVHAWLDERPDPAELLAKVSEITGLPKPAEEEDEEKEKPVKPKKASAKTSAKAAPKAEDEGDANSSDATEKPEQRKPSPEDREKRRAERKVASGAGEATEAKKPEAATAADSPEAGSGGEKEMQAEDAQGAAADAAGGSDTGGAKEDNAGDIEARAGGEEAEPEEKTGG